jgi:hypothetical protein
MSQPQQLNETGRFVKQNQPHAAVAIVDHPHLGKLRAVGSFRPDERQLFEAQFATWSMRCIHLNGDRYLLDSEYAPFSIGGSDDWDEEAVQQHYAADQGLSHGYDVQRAAQEEAAALEQFALGEKKTLEGYLKNPIVDLGQTVFGRGNRTYGLWQAAAVVASRFGDSDSVIAFRSAATNFEEAIAGGDDVQQGQREFHRQLLAMAAPDLADQFDTVWPHIQVSFRKDAASIGIIRRIVDTLAGNRGVPYGADNPVQAMSDYLRFCTV